MKAVLRRERTVCCVAVLLLLRILGEGVPECVFVGVEEDALRVVVAGTPVGRESEDVLANGLFQRELGRLGAGRGDHGETEMKNRRGMGRTSRVALRAGDGPGSV